MQGISYKNIYFLGIGGIGMSALARCFNAMGCHVGGYDKTATPLTDSLISEGMPVHFTDHPDNIPTPFTNPADTLVVITPAIPTESTEWAWFRAKGFTIKKRAEVLGILSAGKYTIAISGTHGKTTTTTLTTHILQHTGTGCTAFLGGIAKNYGTNFVLHPESNLLVVEADEFDRSFLHLHPDVLVITSIDADHLDIYKDRADIVSTFNQLVAQIKPGGHLILKKGLEKDITPRPDIHVYSYTRQDGGDFYASNIHRVDDRYVFDLVQPGNQLTNTILGIQGLVNIENTVAATAIASILQLDGTKVQQSVKTFEGSARRFDYHVRTPQLVVIDDYAHHPAELEAFISSVRHIYPDKRITGVFQPHLYTRTRDFADDFAKSLSLLDELWLLPIYPAREQAIPGIDSAMLLQKVTCGTKHLADKNTLVKALADAAPEVLLMMGAGDIDGMVIKVVEELSS